MQALIQYPYIKYIIIIIVTIELVCAVFMINQPRDTETAADPIETIFLYDFLNLYQSNKYILG